MNAERGSSICATNKHLGLWWDLQNALVLLQNDFLMKFQKSPTTNDAEPSFYFDMVNQSAF